MVSWKAKKVSIVFRAELARVEEPGRAIRQNENPARFPRGVSGTLMHGVWGDCWRTPLGKHKGAPEVPGG